MTDTTSTPAREFNPLLSLTAGLEALHARARAAHAAGTGAYSSTGAVLTLGHAMPLLAKRYRFLHKMGEGTFAQLICAEDTLKAGPHRQVAIKIMHRPFTSIGVREAKLLREIHARHQGGQLQSVLRLLGSFSFLGHFCLVVELLNAAPLSLSRSLSMPSVHTLKVLRKVSFQALSVLLFLGRQQVIHADLKPENVLLVHRPELDGHQSYAIKLIDFGNAMYVHEAVAYHDDYEAQSLLYRAPEVLVGIPFGLPIDVWSLGCILVELCLGRTLFEGHTREHVLAQLVRLRGGLDPAVFSSGLYWRPMHATEPCLDKREGTARLAQLLGINDASFVSFVDGLLQLDPARRLTPWQALCHPFLETLLPLRQYLGADADAAAADNSSADSTPPLQPPPAHRRLSAVPPTPPLAKRPRLDVKAEPLGPHDILLVDDVDDDDAAAAVVTKAALRTTRTSSPVVKWEDDDDELVLL